MDSTHPIACRCGAFQGEVQRPRHGTRAVCYCRDCQAFARFLALPTGMLDELGGTDVVVIPPRHVTLTQGREQLTCMSLSASGTLRWYTSCCKTPIGNTPRNPKLHHVGLVHTCLETQGRGLEASFGPVRMRVSAPSALGNADRNSPIAFALGVSGYLASVAWSRLSRKYRINPFFRMPEGKPLVEPQVVSAAERLALRGAA